MERDSYWGVRERSMHFRVKFGQWCYMEVVHDYRNCFLVMAAAYHSWSPWRAQKWQFFCHFYNCSWLSLYWLLNWNGWLLFMPTVTRWVQSLTTSTFFLQIVNGYIPKLICSFVTVTFMLEAMATANALIQLKKNKVIINVIFCCIKTSCSYWRNEHELAELCCETGTTSLSRKLVSFSVSWLIIWWLTTGNLSVWWEAEWDWWVHSSEWSLGFAAGEWSS